MATFEKHEKEIPSFLGGLRLDICITHLFPHISRSKARRLIDFGSVHLNGKRVKRQSYLVRGGERLTLYEHNGLEAVAVPRIRVLFWDGSIMVIHKPCRLFSQETEYGDAWTVDAQARRYIAEHRKGHRAAITEKIVTVHHRLDFDASGLLLLSTDKSMAKRVNALFLDRGVEKRYYAVVHGVPESDHGEIILPLRYDGRTRRSLVDPIRGKEAVTHYQTKLKLSNGIFSLLECEIETGRTHQIRAHLNHVGHSIVGDRTYCADPRMERREARLYLHAWRLSFIHPVSGIGLDFRLGLPREFIRFLAEKNR